MKHSIKAKIKKWRYGIYTYSHDFLRFQNTGFGKNEHHKNRTYSANMRHFNNPALKSRAYEKLINELLPTLEVGLENAVLILSPYRISVMSAIYLVRTEKTCRIRFTIKGMRGSGDFSREEQTSGTAHIIPLIGFYENAKNEVIIQGIDSDDSVIFSKTIKVPMPNVSKDYYNTRIALTTDNDPVPPGKEQFFLVTGGFRGPTFVVDSHANFRAFLSEKPQYYGIYPLSNGHFMFSDMYIKRPTFGIPHSVVSFEMDWMGRCHYVLYHDRGFHHDMAETSDGNLLTLTSSFWDRNVENTITKIERSTGRILYEINLNDLFDDTYVTLNDWVHINSIDFCEEEGMAIFSLRNVHSIIKVDLKNKKLIWVISHPNMYKDTSMADLLLKPEAEFKPWFFQQHSAKIIHDYPNAEPGRLYLTIYDNHTANRRPVDWFNETDESYGMILSVDEKNRTVRQEKVYPTSMTATRANTIVDVKNRRFFAMDARYPELRDGWAADIREMDLETGELLREYKLGEDFFAVTPFEFDLSSMMAPLDKELPLARGALAPPERTEISNKMKKAKIMPEDNPFRLSYQLYDDVLMIRAIDQDLEEIILKNDAESYHIDYLDLKKLKLEQPIKMFKDSRYWHALPLVDIPAGEYRILVRIKKEYYITDRSVTIQDT